MYEFAKWFPHMGKDPEAAKRIISERREIWYSHTAIVKVALLSLKTQYFPPQRPLDLVEHHSDYGNKSYGRFEDGALINVEENIQLRSAFRGIGVALQQEPYTPSYDFIAFVAGNLDGAIHITGKVGLPVSLERESIIHTIAIAHILWQSQYGLFKD